MSAGFPSIVISSEPMAKHGGGKNSNPAQDPLRSMTSGNVEFAVLLSTVGGERGAIAPRNLRKSSVQQETEQSAGEAPKTRSNIDGTQLDASLVPNGLREVPGVLSLVGLNFGSLSAPRFSRGNVDASANEAAQAFPALAPIVEQPNRSGRNGAGNLLPDSRPSQSPEQPPSIKEVNVQNSWPLPMPEEQALDGVKLQAAFFGANDDPASTDVMKKVTFTSFETHFPLVLSQMSPGPSPATSGEQTHINIHVAPASQTGHPPQLAGAPTKILSFELEPESLGAVTVKMRISRSNIDVQISVNSTDTLTMLNSSRDRLVEALQASGSTVDSFTIQTSQTPVSGDNSQGTASGGDQNAGSRKTEPGASAHAGQDGASRDQRNNDPNERPRHSETRRQVEADRLRVSGRGSGLYL